MDLLKKVKSATLIEALVATVLIVVVFVIASLILNNLLLNSFSKNTHGVETRLAELQYQASYNLIRLPHNETFQNWNIKIEQTRTDKTWITLQAVNQNKKEVIKTFLYEKQ